MPDQKNKGNYLFQFDHVKRGLDRLLGQFDDAEDIKKVTEIILEQVQDAEDMMLDLHVLRLLDTATGDALDQIGKIVGEKREGLSDDRYREFIQSRIRSNEIQGTIPEIIQVLKTMSRGEKVVYTELYPAAYELDIRGSRITTSLGKRIFRRGVKISPLGVQLDKIAFSGSDCFRFDDGTSGFGSNWCTTVYTSN